MTNVTGQQPLCSYNKYVCKCSGKCNCKLPELPKQQAPCPYNKEVCKSSGKCHCEVSSEAGKYFTKRPAEKIECITRNANVPLKVDVTELDYKFGTKDGVNTTRSQPWLDASPCPFKTGCPFC